MWDFWWEGVFQRQGGNHQNTRCSPAAESHRGCVNHECATPAGPWVIWAQGEPLEEFLAPFSAPLFFLWPTSPCIFWKPLLFFLSWIRVLCYVRLSLKFILFQQISAHVTNPRTLLCSLQQEEVNRSFITDLASRRTRSFICQVEIGRGGGMASNWEWV